MNNNSPICLVVCLCFRVYLSPSIRSIAYGGVQVGGRTGCTAWECARIGERTSGRVDERAISVGGAVGSAVGWASRRTGGSVNGRAGGRSACRLADWIGDQRDETVGRVGGWMVHRGCCRRTFKLRSKN